jgi:GIY-YIG catalytic domain-containing protein
MFKKLLNRTRISLKSQPRYIYALIDPRDDTVRYVGVTRDVYFRLSRHVKDASKMDRKGTWINGLEQLGLSPELEILETVELETIELNADIDVVALEREKYWIHEFLKSGAPLLNISSVSQAQQRGPRRPPPRIDVQDATPLTPFGEARVRARLTVAQLCAEANVSPSVVQKIKRDEPVTGPVASRLCRVLSRYLDQPVTYEGLGIRILESRRRKR